MRDLFMSLDAQTFVKRARVSRQHFSDGKERASALVEQKPVRQMTPSQNQAKLAAKRLQRQAEIVEIVRVYARDSALTVDQILRNGGYDDTKDMRAAIKKDCEALCKRGLLQHKKTKSVRINSFVDAYWVAE